MALGPHAESEAEVLEKHELKGTVGGRIALTLVTPRGSLLDKQADELVAPGAEGEFGVLPGHVPFLAALKPGVLVVRDGTTRSIYAVGSGFLEVGTEAVTRILVENALLAADIDVAAAKAEATELLEQQKATPEATREANALLLSRLAWAQARVAASAAAHVG